MGFGMEAGEQGHLRLSVGPQGSPSSVQCPQYTPRQRAGMEGRGACSGTLDPSWQLAVMA